MSDGFSQSNGRGLAMTGAGALIALALGYIMFYPAADETRADVQSDSEVVDPASDRRPAAVPPIGLAGANPSRDPSSVPPPGRSRVVDVESDPLKALRVSKNPDVKLALEGLELARQADRDASRVPALRAFAERLKADRPAAVRAAIAALSELPSTPEYAAERRGLIATVEAWGEPELARRVLEQELIEFLANKRRGPMGDLTDEQTAEALSVKFDHGHISASFEAWIRSHGDQTIEPSAVVAFMRQQSDLLLQRDIYRMVLIGKPEAIPALQREMARAGLNVSEIAVR